MGLAAAMTEQRACRLVTMPALEMEMLCCSIACIHTCHWLSRLQWFILARMSNCMHHALQVLRQLPTHGLEHLWGHLYVQMTGEL